MDDVNPYRMQLLSLLLALIVSALLEMPSATAPATPANSSPAVAEQPVPTTGAAVKSRKETTGKRRSQRQRGPAGHR